MFSLPPTVLRRRAIPPPQTRDLTPTDAAESGRRGALQTSRSSGRRSGASGDELIPVDCTYNYNYDAGYGSELYDHDVGRRKSRTPADESSRTTPICRRRSLVTSDNSIIIIIIIIIIITYLVLVPPVPSGTSGDELSPSGTVAGSISRVTPVYTHRL